MVKVTQNVLQCIAFDKNATCVSVLSLASYTLRTLPLSAKDVACETSSNVVWFPDPS